jgi:hypothetical protein
MIFGFDEHKGKVDVGAMLTQLQTNFQNNVNSLYNAFVAKGVTPAAKTVSALVTAVTSLYDAGVAATKKGDAVAGNVLNGKYFTSNSAGVNIKGTMANYSGNNRQTVIPAAGTGNQQLPLSGGYHDSVIVNRTPVYNKGKADAEALQFVVNADTYGVSNRQYNTLRVGGMHYAVNVKNESRWSKAIYGKWLDASSNLIGSMITVAYNATVTPPTGAEYFEASLVDTSTDGFVSLAITYQAKKLRN